MAQHNLDNIEALMDIAEKKPAKSEKPIKFEDTEVEKFIYECNISEGDKKISTYTIYYNYYVWKKNKRKLMTRRAFFLQFMKHFKNIPTDDGRGYLLNEDPFDLTAEGFFKARSLLRRERHARKQKIQKKSS